MERIDVPWNVAVVEGNEDRWSRLGQRSADGRRLRNVGGLIACNDPLCYHKGFSSDSRLGNAAGPTTDSAP